jgi:putative FmdB family regulatory protein
VNEMPLYEYVCKDCGKTFEKIVGWSDFDHPQTCPSCKSENTSKKISLSGRFGSTLFQSSSSSCGSSGGFS